MDMDTESWYVLDPATQQPQGPFTLDRMRSRAADGSLDRSSQVARAGAPGWTPAGTDPLLAPLFGLAATPPTAPQPLPGPVGEPYTFGNAWRLGERTIKARYKAMLLVGLTVFAINLPTLVPALVLSPAFRDPQVPPSLGTNLGLNCMSWLYNLLVMFPLFYGAVVAGAEASQGRGSVSDLFAGFRRYGTAIGANLLVMAITVGVALLVYLPLLAGITIGFAAGGGSMMFTGLIVGAILSIATFVLLVSRVVMRVLLAPVVAIDPAMGSLGVADSFRRSWAATKGLGPSMFGFLIASGALTGLTIFLCGIGYVLLGLPLLYTMFGSMYQLAIRNAPRAAA